MRTQNSKKIALVLSLVILFLPFSVVPVKASVGITPYYINLQNITVELEAISNKLELYCDITGFTGTTSITATAILERQNSNGSYTEVTRWDNLSATGRYLSFDESYYVATGYTYRLRINATVYLNGVGESVNGSATCAA